jgi:hypothetical protein
MRIQIAALAAFGLCTLAGAQDVLKKEIVEDRLVMLEGTAQHAVPVPGPRHGVAGASFEWIHHGGAVKGAPYSAESVVEHTQTLADGNRIVHRQTSKMYRDSEGRTRMDGSIQPLGPWVPDGKAGSISVIHDPVSGEHFTVNHVRKTVSKAVMKKVRAGAPPPGETFEIRVAAKKATPGGPAPLHDILIPAPGATVMWIGEKETTKLNVRQEKLGKRAIEGVECDGTRETFTIAAGEAGNDRPIEVVTERWFSPELQLDVYRKHSDPRFGENVSRITSLIRGEQPRQVFEPPADYKVEEVGKADHTIRFERKQ